MDEFQSRKPQVSQPDAEMVSTITKVVLQTLNATGDLKQGGTARKPAQPETKTIDLVALFFSILEKFWVVALCAIIGMSGMGLIASRSVTTYTATAKLYIVNPEGDAINLSNLQLGTALTMDYQEVFKTWEVHEMVIEELGLPYSYEQMQKIMSVNNPKDTRILYITVSYPDGKMAAEIANAYARAGKTFIINTMRSEEPSDFSIALEPSVGYTVSKSNSMLKGFLLGSVLAVGLLTLLFVLDTSPHSPEEIERAADIPTLAIFPAEARDKAGKPSKRSAFDRMPAGDGQNVRRMVEATNFDELDFAGQEAVNTLCTNLSYCGGDIRKIMLTSRYSGEGKSYISMNLMRNLAALGRRVVLVDADLRASGIQTDYRLRYNTKKHCGLTEYLSGQCNMQDILYQTTIEGAYLIPAGHEAPNPLQLLDTDTMKRLIDRLSESFDVVLLDTPPIGMLVDATALAKFCDGMLLVVRYHKGKQSDIDDAVRSVKQTGCRVLGAVLNDVKFRKLSNKYYYYHSERYAGHYSKRYYGKKRPPRKV